MAIRLVREGRAITPKLDRKRPGDATYEHDGRAVLLLGEDVVEEIDSKILDVEDTEDGTQFILN